MTTFVYLETMGGEILPSALEALSAAQQIGEPITALVFGISADQATTTLATCGIERIILCPDESLHPFHLEAHAPLLSHLIREYQPRHVLATATANSRELLAVSALDCAKPFIADALSFAVTEDGLTITRAAYAGKVLEQVRSTSETTFITLRARAFSKPQALDNPANVTIETVEPAHIPDGLRVHVESEESANETVTLMDAAIVVSGGRGLANNPKPAPSDAEDPDVWKARDGFATLIQPLAQALNAAVGASRAAVDAGYIDYDHQVGQTGKTVTPDLYIAAGISGAVQHQAGMRNSKIIVAINRDADAPIFKLAHYGIVGDLYDVLPRLIEAVEQEDQP